MTEVLRDNDADKTKSIFCFAVSPEFRGKGIASQLLNRVCLDAKAEGFSYVEAYPNNLFSDQAKEFMGTKSMYLKEGFEEIYAIDNKSVVRKLA